MAKDYTSTLNLPTTSFEMRANLPVREPNMLEYWNSMDLYHQMLQSNEGKPLYVLHDGPPFSNGKIHMGTAMNKILKDFINKSKSMMGYCVPFVPGWDNHGMPIESAIIKKNKLNRKAMSIPEFRSACHDFAQDFIDIQREQFIRLGVTGDWKNPYTTMSPAFEGREVRVFGDMFRKGYIYKGLKPVYWCPKDETALAEAEIEYRTDRCTSIYVKFKVKDDAGKLSGICDIDRTYFIIWTTTTWTLPGNQLITLNPVEDYVVVKAENGECYIIAQALCDKTMAEGGVTSWEVLTTMKGKEFEFMTAQHPFLDRASLIAVADYVTMDTGTGCVHTAGGFGADDYVTSCRYGVKIVVPVDDRGYQTEDAGKFAGLYYDESNAAILEDLKDTGALFASREFEHEYPHCWRCKSPIIFRATPQWFCSVDAFRTAAMDACDDVTWMPAWGGDRMKQMLGERADWCISRQRQWGLPIPVFYCADCKQTICTEQTIEKVADMFAEHGSNCWFSMGAAELLPDGYVCPQCGGKHFLKEQNTLDGWFDSGSTHFSVLEDHPELPNVADLYLEGADQYRGWFQSSLLTAVGARGQGAPYRAVLTHGWVVDGEGKAMHKSLGNSILPDEIIPKYGAEIIRLWVASSDYQVDVRVSDAILKQLSEAYRKIRNTARIILANLNDFDPNTDMVALDDMYEIDHWILSRLNVLTTTCREAYETFNFHVIYHDLTNFCTTDLSKLYVDITKDRVYTERKDSSARRSAQTAMYLVLSAMTRLMAPLLAFTSEEIWQTMPHAKEDKTASVFLNDMPTCQEAYEMGKNGDRWNQLFVLRDDVMKALEIARADKKIGKSLDAKLTIYTEDEGQYALLDSFGEQLKTVFIVSGVALQTGTAPSDALTETASGIGVLVETADGCKCDRCWMYSVKGNKTEDEGFLCERCLHILED